MEDASHGGLDGSVVEIDRFWVVRSAPRAEWLSRSEQGFDGFVAQDEERRHRPETGRQRLVAASVADSADDVLAAEFLQIISGVAGNGLWWGLLGARATPSRHVGGGEAIWRGGQSDQRLEHRAHACLVEIDAPDDGFADLRGCRQLFEQFIGDEALIDATESIGKPFQHAFQSPHHLGELLQRATAVELARVMSNRLDAKDAFAFAIDLQSQLAAVQLEDRQIIGRSLDRDLPFGRPLGSTADFRTMLVSEDGLDGLQIERRAAAVDQRLKHLFHVPADLKDQVSAVLDLIARILLTKPAALLLLKIEREAQTGRVNPTLADLAQSPYSPLLGQGVCDLRQACGVGDISKTVSLLGEGNAGLAGLAGDVLMAV